jgi:NitT/TauT family transport system ATP-binding protein
MSIDTGVDGRPVTVVERSRGLAVERITRTYHSREREVLALDDVSVDLDAGGFLAVVGPSGCGKSTLMNMIAGILPVTEGTIVHAGRKVSDINRHVGYMTQQDAVLPWRTVEANVELPLRFHKMRAAERRTRVEAMLQTVGLTGFNKSYPAELSGGMRKRVAIAQLLAYGPDTLLLDEPFGALDAQLKLMMQEQLLAIWAERQQTVVFVTHDLAEAVTVASRVIVFSGRPGRIKAIETIDLPGKRDVFSIRFRPEFERAYQRLWDALAPEIRRGEAA